MVVTDYAAGIAYVFGLRFSILNHHTASPDKGFILYPYMIYYGNSQPDITTVLNYPMPADITARGDDVMAAQIELMPEIDMLSD